MQSNHNSGQGSIQSRKSRDTILFKQPPQEEQNIQEKKKGNRYKKLDSE